MRYLDQTSYVFSGFIRQKRQPRHSSAHGIVRRNRYFRESNVSTTFGNARAVSYSY